MTNIEKLIYGVNERNIRAKTQQGKYSIDLDYVDSGVKYYLFRCSEQIAIVHKNIKEKTVSVYYEKVITQEEQNNIHKAVEFIAENLYKTYYVKIS